MKYRDFECGDSVLVKIPQRSYGFEHPQRASVIEKGKKGIVLFQKPNGKRWWANAHRILVVEGE